MVQINRTGLTKAYDTSERHIIVRRRVGFGKLWKPSTCNILIACSSSLEKDANRHSKMAQKVRTANSFTALFSFMMMQLPAAS